MIELEMCVNDDANGADNIGLATMLEKTPLKKDMERKRKKVDGKLAAELVVGIAIGVGTGITANAVYDACKAAVGWLRGKKKKTVSVFVTVDGKGKSTTFDSDELPTGETLRQIAADLASTT